MTTNIKWQDLFFSCNAEGNGSLKFEYKATQPYTQILTNYWCKVMCFFLHHAVVPFFFCIFARYKKLFT